MVSIATRCRRKTFRMNICFFIQLILNNNSNNNLFSECKLRSMWLWINVTDFYHSLLPGNLPKVETLPKWGRRNPLWCGLHSPTFIAAEVWLGSSWDQTLPQDCKSFQDWCWPEITPQNVFTILHLGKNRKGRGTLKFNFLSTMNKSRKKT